MYIFLNFVLTFVNNYIHSHVEGKSCFVFCVWNEKKSSYIEEYYYINSCTYTCCFAFLSYAEFFSDDGKCVGYYWN